MFHFQRRTLWIIIYITIPLIIILNNLGSDQEAPAALQSGNDDKKWSLDQVSVQQVGTIHWLKLPSASQIRMSLVLNRLPTTSLVVDNASAFSSQLQGGKMVLTLSNPVNESVLEDSLAFLKQWLPKDIESIVVSGPFNLAWAELINHELAQTQGDSMAITIGAVGGLAQLTSPPMHSPDQLAFLMAVSIIKQRLAGYDIQMSWDHRRSQSVVRFNSTLSSESLYPVSMDEFQPVFNAFLASAKVRERSQSQLHRYLQTAMVYNIPFNFFVEQPSRLAQVTMDDVNRMMELALAQIKTPRQ